MKVLFWIGVLAGLGIVLFALDRLALWMERHGWIFYRHTKATGTMMGGAFRRAQSFVEPGMEHYEEELRTRDFREEDQAGDPPEDEDGQGR